MSFDAKKALKSLKKRRFGGVTDYDEDGNKLAAKEHGLMEHKGKTIPKEVKSLADRIRKEEPDRSDEYAYRTAWDIYRSHTAEGRQYPNRSPESGLKREGGGTGPLSKTAGFWSGFEKRAKAVSRDDLIYTLKKHEERETPEQELRENEREERVERDLGIEQ